MYVGRCNFFSNFSSRIGLSCVFQKEPENKKDMSPYFIKSSEHFDNRLIQTRTSKDIENKGNRSLSFIENVDEEVPKLNMSKWNIILLSSAVAGFATIVVTVTCLVCVCCRKERRKCRQNNPTQYSSPDILMNVAGKFSSFFFLHFKTLIFK